MKKLILIILLLVVSCTDNNHTVTVVTENDSAAETPDKYETENLDQTEVDIDVSQDIDINVDTDQFFENVPDPDYELPDTESEIPDIDEVPDDPDFEYPPSEDPPINLEDIDAYFYSDISYDENIANRFDLFAAKSTEPAPIVIFIHGGGFTAGDKDEAYGAAGPFVIRDLLTNGISYATINYRLLEQNDKVGVIKPLNDCKRALQFIRNIADLFNIDKTKVGLYGFSAGAGASMWIGFQDELADPQNVDPVLRESTRVNAVGALETQATYDLVRWETEILKPFDITLQMAANLGMKDLILSFYGISTLDELYTPETENYRNKVDMLDLISEDDPEMYVSNAYDNAGKPTDLYGLLHHPNHAKAVMDKADEIGADGLFFIDALGIADPTNELLIQFMIRKLK